MPTALSQRPRRSVTATELSLIEAEELPPEQRIALAYTPAASQDKLAVVFALDQRLSRIVAQATEPMLAQLRLAWWRDELAKLVSDRPSGDAVLDAVGTHWLGEETHLISLVDAWEVMLTEPPIMRGAAKSFANGRAAPFAHLAGPEGGDDWQRVHGAASRWALADAAVHMSNGEERDTFIGLGLDRAAKVGRIPRNLRGIAVLEALALRSLKNGGAPLMEGRGAALIALRLGIFGR